MIDPVTSWIEIAPIPEDDMSSDKISTLFYDYWLCRYPRPAIVTYDNGSEFKKEFKRLCVEYDLDERPTTIKNPQANGIVERVHQVIGDMLRAFNIDELSLDKEDPFGEILARVGWAIRSTYHTTLQATPGQLVFGRDMLLDIKHTANWHNTHHRRQVRMDKNNINENLKRLSYNYKVGDKILILKTYLQKQRKLAQPYEGPYTIVEIFTNGTVKYEKKLASAKKQQ